MSRTASRATVFERIDQLCRVLEPLAEGLDFEAIQAARSILTEPLRVAVVGRVSTGKSTLVNALVGRRVAPTRAGECTRVVTWYRFGAPDQAQLHLLDGSVRQVRLVDGGLPEELDVPAEQVERLDVRLASGTLRTLTLIDTPGLDTMTVANEAATRRAVLGDVSRRAAGQADALVYLVGDAARLGDMELLAEFRASSGDLTTTSLNAVGVIARADRLGGGPFEEESPFDIAGRLAAGLHALHPAQLATVVAVSGLLAETARTGRITEALAGRLAQLASEDPIALSLRAGDPALAELHDLFGPYGVRTGRESARGGATELGRWADSISGIQQLEAALRTRLVPRADVMRARRTLGDLDRIARSWPPPRRSAALDLLEAAKLDPALHPVREFRALAGLLTEVPSSPLVAQLEAFVDRRDVGQLLELAGEQAAPDPGLDRVGLARARAAAATSAATLAQRPEEIEAGRVLARSWFLLSRSLSEGTR